MNIFITGASGFIGGAIARRLKEEHSIFAMARSTKSIVKVSNLGITPIKCSLNHVTKEDLKDIDVVIHAAAFVEAWGTRQQFWKTNVDGTRQLIEVAIAAGVTKFIHISTEACLFHGQSMDNIDETYPYAESTPYLYSETKREAEKIVLEANASNGMQTIAIRPRMVWGPEDNTILPELIKIIKAGSFKWINKGQSMTSTTHIDNLIEGVHLALQNGTGGEAYFIIDDGNVTIKSFLTGLLDTMNMKVSDSSVPSFILRYLAVIIEKSWRLFNIKSEPPITRFAADIMAVNCTIDGTKAKQQLKYIPVISREEGLKSLKEYNLNQW